MASFIAVDIAKRSRPMHPASAHLFVDHESSKNDFENTALEMKTESSPVVVPVAEPVDQSNWTCAWCYRENEWRHERCPACDRFKISHEASQGYLGKVIKRVKAASITNPGKIRKSGTFVDRKGRKGRKTFRQSIKDIRKTSKNNEVALQRNQMLQIANKTTNWKDGISYGPMKVKEEGGHVRFDKCHCCGLMKQGPLCRCTEDHLVCDSCKALVEIHECPVCVEQEIKNARFEAGRQFITHQYWEVPTTILAIIVLFLEDTELMLYAHTYKEDPQNDDAIFWLFMVLKVLSFLLFLFDLVVRTIVTPQGENAYLFTLTWWLDLISTLCLLPYADIASLLSEGGGELGVVSESLKVLNLIKLLRVLRAIKVLHLLKRFAVKKKKGGKKNAAENASSNANEMHAELTRVLTTKVIVFILVLYAGFPLLKMLLGDVCSSPDRMQALGAGNLEQLDIALSVSGQLETMTNSKACEANAFCSNAVQNFKDAIKFYLDDFLTNVTIAGVAFSSMGGPDGHNTSWVRIGKGFYRHVCVVHADDRQWVCMNSCNAVKKGSCCPDNSCGWCDRCFDGSSDPSKPLPYWFTIDLTKAAYYDAVYSMIATFFLMLLLAGAVAILYREVGYISTEVARPVIALAKDMEDVSKLVFNGDMAKIFMELAYKSKVYEVSMMKISFIRMKHAIRAFSKFVPREVVRHLVVTGKDARLDVGERTMVTFFSDIASFTSICEALNPQQLYKLLSDYFEEMSRIIMDTHGTLIEYIGDAILAVWNAPLQPEKHPSCLGICASLLMQDKLLEMRVKWGETIFKQIEDLPALRVRCGLHEGETYVGNIGSPVRMKFGVVGESVHLAGSLEELNKKYSTEILVSAPMAQTPAVSERIICRKIDFLIADTYRDYVSEPLTTRDNTNESSASFAIAIASCHQEAFELYEQQQFGEAMLLFEKAEQLCINSQKFTPTPAQMLKQRCLHYQQNPPLADWNFT